MTAVTIRPLVALVAAALAVAAVAAGTTYAATRTSPQVVHACVNPHGTLKLLSNGRCAPGYSKVGIDRSGVQGPPGRRGPRGAAGPGPQVASAMSTTATPGSQDVLVAALNLRVRTICNVGGLPSATEVYFSETSGTADIVVSGSVLVQKSGGAASYSNEGTQKFFADGLSQVEITEPGDDPYDLHFIADAAGGNTVRMRAELTFERAGKTALVRLFLDQDPTHNRCRSSAAVIPAD